MNKHPTSIGSAESQRIEEAALNAWPALQQQFYDGWILRFSKGFTKRANSIVPLYAGRHDRTDAVLADRVRYCENLYAREGLQTVFRLTSINPCPELEPFLASRGYELADPTQVLVRPLGRAHPIAKASPAGHFSLLGLDEWLSVYSDLAQVPAQARTLHGALLRGIQGPMAFAVVTDGANPVACGLGVIEDGLLGLFDVVTHPSARRQGHGQRLVNGLLTWGEDGGATRAYLQMLASNEPATALYAKASFVEQYRYWYRIDA